VDAAERLAPRITTAGDRASKDKAQSARSWRSLLPPLIAVPKCSAMALLKKLMYGSSDAASRRPRDRPTGSMPSRSAAVQRSSLASV
jgi:hypothetical protein